MVCFVPTITLNSAALHQHFRKVVTALLDVGFFVVLVLLDGHKTNIKFFTELGEGSLEISIQNPLYTELKMFTMFDPVHLYKNFYHNFERNR